MQSYIRLLSFVRPYWRRLLAAFMCMAVFAALSGVSLGMILPFVNVLFQEELLVEDGAQVSAPTVADTAAAHLSGVAGDDSREATGAGEKAPEAATSAPAERGGASESDPAAGMAAVESLKDGVKSGVLGLFASATRTEALGRICVALLALFLIKGIFGYLQTFLMITIEQSVIRDIRDRLFTRLSTLSLSFFHGKRTGQLISRITNDVALVRRALVASLANLFRESLLTLLYLGLAIWISWRLALITFVVLPPIVLVMARIGQRLRKRSARIQERMADITSTLHESISGIRVVKAFGMEEYERRRFFVHTLSYFRTYVRMELLGALAAPLTEYLGVIGVVVVLWYGGREVLVSGTVSSDWFIIFLAATLSTMQPLRKLSKANNELQVGMAAAKRIFEVLDTEPEITSRPGARRLDSFRERIVYEDAGFSYDRGDEVLRGISLEIGKGEVVAIVGPSGAGKSTLLDLLPRFYDATSGRITVDGEDVRDIELGSLRDLMGIVTQETILFNDTVRSNIAYGLEGARPDDIEAAARAANAHDFIAAMPDGYDTMIGERGVKLSGGERQRIAVARAILKNPPILIFDEATSSLDTESERLVQDAIERLLRGRTVLVIAHRLSTVRNADRIVVLDRGEIVESGKHQELMAQGGLYRHLYDMQFADEPPDGQHPGSS